MEWWAAMSAGRSATTAPVQCGEGGAQHLRFVTVTEHGRQYETAGVRRGGIESLAHGHPGDGMR
jgi:hypothetical protein